MGVAIIVRKENKVLNGKRRGSHGEGTWAFPGGHLELGESFEDCVNREIMEECNIRVKNIRFGAVTNDIFSAEKHYITVFMICDYAGGRLKTVEPEKCEKWDWFEWGALPKPFFLPEENLLKQNFNPFTL